MLEAEHSKHMAIADKRFEEMRETLRMGFDKRRQIVQAVPGRLQNGFFQIVPLVFQIEKIARVSIPRVR